MDESDVTTWKGLKSEVVVSIIGVGVVQLTLVISGWIQVQSRLRAVEVRQEISEKQMDTYTKSFEKLSDGVQHLAVELAKYNRWEGASYTEGRRD